MKGKLFEKLAFLKRVSATIQKLAMLIIVRVEELSFGKNSSMVRGRKRPPFRLRPPRLVQKFFLQNSCP